MIRNFIAIGVITGFIGSAFAAPATINANNNTLASSVLSEKTVKKTTSAIKSIASTDVTQIKNMLRSSVDSFTLSQIERIEWAIRKKDIRLCKDLADAVNTDTSSTAEKHSAGEYLALCVAMVTKNSARCDRIFSKSDTLLHAFCTDELAST